MSQFMGIVYKKEKREIRTNLIFSHLSSVFSLHKNFYSSFFIVISHVYIFGSVRYSRQFHEHVLFYRYLPMYGRSTLNNDLMALNKRPNLITPYLSLSGNLY